MKKELPLEVIAPSKDWKKQKILMLGQAGTGKSSFWAQDPATFFFDCEGNLNHLPVKRIRCACWDDVREVFGLLTQMKPMQYTTIVVDPIDRLISYAIEETIWWAKQKYSDKVAEKINTIGDIPEGNGWYYLSTFVNTFIQKI